MSDSDDLDDDDDFMDELIEKTSAVNRRVAEKVVVHNPVVQRTLTGERLDTEPARYEEIRHDITFHPTHHDMNRINLSTYLYPSNYEVRDYQFDVIKKALFTNLLCAIPTGMGKTFIASTVMLNYYRWFKSGKIIFMAPTRPLVAQQIQACLGVTDIPSSDTAILLDKARKNRPEIWNSKRVFFTTPQVVENDLKTGILNPKDIVCLVIDEAHRARGNYAYTNVVQFMYRFNTSFRVLALTATPAADIDGVQEVVNNLKLSLIEIRTEESPDIVKYMKNKETVRIKVGLNSEMEDIIELLGEAIDPILKQANEANIYDVTEVSRISHFAVLQKSQAIIRNPSLPEGVKWKYYFILQVIGYVGQMVRRLKIYGIRTFYSYFQNKCKEFKTKYSMGKSTNKMTAGFFYHHCLKQIDKICGELLARNDYISHPKLEHLMTELVDFFEEKKASRVIIFTELRESALEIVKCIDNSIGDKCKPHIFIGQARGKEGFDEDDYKMKNGKKGRGKQKKLEREEMIREMAQEKEKKKQDDANKRAASRTGTSEEAQLQGMNQKLQKELIKQFKKGDINVLVATSIGEEGLDIGEVDLIICYDSTSSPIKNIQRMGRTGRKHDGKVILLLAGSEESKFDQSMNEYAAVQRQIAGDALDFIESDRIIPKDLNPTCLKKYIDIPEDNLIIARGEDEDEVIKYATQAMLGKNLPKAKKATSKKKKANFVEPPKIIKRFFMPDNVVTGFSNASSLVKKIGPIDEKSGSKHDTSISLDSDDEDVINAIKPNVSNNTSMTSDSEIQTDNNELSIISENLGKNSEDISISLDSDDDEELINISRKNRSNTNTSVLMDSSDEDNITRSEAKFKTPRNSKILKPLNTNDSSSKKQFFRKTEIGLDYELRTSAVPLPELRTDDLVDDKKDIVNQLRDKSPVLSEKESEKETNNSIREGDSPSIESAKVLDNISNSSDKSLKKTSVSIVLSDDEPEEELNQQNDTASKITKEDLLKDFEFEVSDSENDEEDNDDMFIEYNKTKKINGQKASNNFDKLLNFSAFEEPESDVEIKDAEVNTSALGTGKETQMVLDKEYDNDPEFSYVSTGVDTENSNENFARPSKRRYEKELSNQAKVPKVDITTLLKNIQNEESKLKEPKEVEYIDLISQQQQEQEVVKRKASNKSDSIYPNVFEETDGFINPEDVNEFYSNYYSEFTVDSLNVNPTISCHHFVIGKVKHSSISNRFKRFISLANQKGKDKLEKLTEDINRCKTTIVKNEEDEDNQDILKIIVKEDDIEYIENEELSDTETRKGIISSDHVLLSEDDEYFMNL